MRFEEIPQFTRWANYQVNVSWDYLEKHIESLSAEGSNFVLDLDPDFQRAHVWTEEQQRRYVEYILRGGKASRQLLFNCAGWNSRIKNCGPYVLVDGKQRLESVRKFMRGDLSIFHNGFCGNKKPLTIHDFENRPRITGADFLWSVNDLETRKEILQWYLDLNTGGTIHTEEEINKVKKLLNKELKK
jgi:hypothetical protein